MQGSVSTLGAWDNFYVIVGSGAAALTGLMFVVVTLISSISVRRNSGAASAFSGPNVVHFSVAFGAAAVFTAPWQALWPPALLLGACGACGGVYIAIITRRMRRQKDYLPVLEDWTFHVILPLASYVTYLIGAWVLPFNPAPTLFAIAAATILFLFIGIHNAWDSVTYITFQAVNRDDQRQDETR